MPESTPRDGFVAFAEAEHGRLAMLGFVIGLGTELLPARASSARSAWVDRRPSPYGQPQT